MNNSSENMPDNLSDDLDNDQNLEELDIESLEELSDVLVGDEVNTNIPTGINIQDLDLDSTPEDVAPQKTSLLKETLIFVFAIIFAFALTVIGISTLTSTMSYEPEENRAEIPISTNPAEGDSIVYSLDKDGNLKITTTESNGNITLEQEQMVTADTLTNVEPRSANPLKKLLDLLGFGRDTAPVMEDPVVEENSETANEEMPVGLTMPELEAQQNPTTSEELNESTMISEGLTEGENSQNVDNILFSEATDSNTDLSDSSSPATAEQAPEQTQVQTPGQTSISPATTSTSPTSTLSTPGEAPQNQPLAQSPNPASSPASQPSASSPQTATAPSTTPTTPASTPLPVVEERGLTPLLPEERTIGDNFGNNPTGKPYLIDQRTETSYGKYVVQFMSLQDLELALNAAKQLSSVAPGVYVVKANLPGRGDYYRVRAYPVDDRDEADELVSELRDSGYSCYVDII